MKLVPDIEKRSLDIVINMFPTGVHDAAQAAVAANLQRKGWKYSSINGIVMIAAYYRQLYHIHKWVYTRHKYPDEPPRIRVQNL